VKNHLRDALSLVKLLRACEKSSRCWVPDQHHYGDPRFARGALNGGVDLRGKRRQMSAFLLRAGLHYPEETGHLDQGTIFCLLSNLAHAEQRCCSEDSMLGCSRRRELHRAAGSVDPPRPDWSAGRGVLALMAMLRHYLSRQRRSLADIGDPVALS